MTAKTRSRPNAWENRYNQWVLAGKIALATNAMSEITEAVRLKTRSPLGDYNVFCTETGTPHYSLIGQEYLRRIGMTVTEL